jgi:Na+-driven multidrug efflux pump
MFGWVGRPDVPLLISSVKTALNIILDVLLISKFRVGHLDVDVNTQAIIRLSCDAAGALAGVLFFAYLSNILFLSRPSGEEVESRKPSRVALWTLVRQGRYTFIESAIRNVLYLWLVSGIVKMGSDYTTVGILQIRCFQG